MAMHTNTKIAEHERIVEQQHVELNDTAMHEAVRQQEEVVRQQEHQRMLEESIRTHMESIFIHQQMFGM